MLKKAKTTIAGLTAAAVLATSSLVAVPVAQAAGPAALAAPAAYKDAPVTLVRSEKRWKKRRHHHRRHYRSYRHHHHGSNVGAGIAGFALGAIVGSALTQPSYRGSNWHAYCASKYRSYNPRTGTYTGYDGLQHRCR